MGSSAATGARAKAPLAATKAGAAAWRFLCALGSGFRDVLWEPISPKPLAVFRIAVTSVLFVEFLHAAVYRRHLMFLDHPLQGAIDPSIIVDLWIWGIALVLTIGGVLTPIAAFVTYRMTVKYFGLEGPFYYHADMLYVPSILLVALLPTYRAYSVDNLLAKRWFGVDLSAFPIPRFFNNLVIYWVMGFMYFDSTYVYKLRSAFWMDGYGFWVPASYPSFTTVSWNWLLNFELLVKLAGWITLVFELVFVFLFWNPRARKYLLPVGVALHLGIAIVLPLPLFGLLMVVQYILFFPDRQMNALVDAAGALLVRRKVLSRPTGFAAALAAPAKPFLGFDKLLAHVMMIVAVIVTIDQVGITFDKSIFSKDAIQWMKLNAGITAHGVFSQWAFTSMKQDAALVFYDREGHERWLPWVKQNGHVGPSAYSRFWTYWWLTSIPGVYQHPQRMARVSEEWARDNDVDLSRGFVIVKTKSTIADLQWERDRHREREAAPWKDYAKIEWTNGESRFTPLE